MTARRAEHEPLSAKRKAIFLTELARHGVAIRAARVASPDSLTGALQTFADERDRNPEFHTAWKEALESADGDLLLELHRRAVEGVSEDVYGPGGQVVGQRKHVSDRLLVEMLRSRFPREFAAHTVSEVTASVRTRTESLGLDQLSPESRKQLREILERELGSEPYPALPQPESRP